MPRVPLVRTPVSTIYRSSGNLVSPINFILKPMDKPSLQLLGAIRQSVLDKVAPSQELVPSNIIAPFLASVLPWTLRETSPGIFPFKIKVKIHECLAVTGGAENGMNFESNDFIRKWVCVGSCLKNSSSLI